MEYSEKRKFTRIPFRTEIRITSPHGLLISETLRDISLGGAFVLVDNPLEIGTKCDLQIDLIGPASLLRIFIEAEVVRVENGGIAVDFTRIDVDSLIHLKHLIKVHSENPSLVENEFSANLLNVPRR